MQGGWIISGDLKTFRNYFLKHNSNVSCFYNLELPREPAGSVNSPGEARGPRADIAARGQNADTRRAHGHQRWETAVSTGWTLAWWEESLGRKKQRGTGAAFVASLLCAGHLALSLRPGEVRLRELRQLIHRHAA